MQILNGLTIAAIYILLASGLTIVFGLQGIVNVAHGVFYMLGAYLGVALYPVIGFWLSIPAAFLITASLGLGLEVCSIRPLLRRRRPGSHILVLTIGVAIIASELTKLAWGPVPLLSEIPPALHGTIELGFGAYPKYWLFTIGVTVLAMSLLAVAFNRTDLGIRVQAITLNGEMAQALGTNAPKVSTFVFALGSGVAGVAGVFAGPILSVYPTMCFDLLLILFVIVILGGLGSLLGIVVSGILVGLVQSFGVAYLSGTAANILVFLVMILALILRPLGLFGIRR